MNFTKTIYKFLCSATLMCAVGLTSCVDDNLPDCSPSDPFFGDETGIAFTITRAEMGEDAWNNHASSFGNSFENYLDLNRKFRILFFNLENEFLFELGSELDNQSFPENIRPIMQSTSNGVFVFLKRDFLYQEGNGDENDPSTLNGRIFKALEGDKDNGGGFKIAVLANWPETVEGDKIYSGDNFNDDTELGNGAPIPCHIAFCAYPKGDEKCDPNKFHSLFDLVHSVRDNVYGAYGSDGSSYVNTAYSHLVGPDGKMGVYSVWVHNFHNTKADAENFIRSGISGVEPDNWGDVSFTYSMDKYDPARHEKLEEMGDYDKSYTYNFSRNISRNGLKVDYTINDVWRIWNFGNGTNPDVSYNTPSEAVRQYWTERGSEILIPALNKYQTEKKKFTADGLTFVPRPDKDNNYEAASGSLKVESSTGHPALTDFNDPDERYSNLIEKCEKGSNYFHFRVYQRGKLHIKAVATGSGKVRVLSVMENQPAKNIQVNGEDLWTDDDPLDPFNTTVTFNGSIEDITAPTTTSDITPTDNHITVNINPQSRRWADVYIYAIGGTVNFYEIEYVSDRHIYDIDRTGLFPDEDANPIPFYGVQEFDPISNWNEGLFHLSYPSTASKNYNHKQVFLLRSIAKIEVEFKKSALGNRKPSHVYLRSSNRSARCTTKDSWTPTEDLWFGKPDDPAYPWHIDGVELANIMAKGHTYADQSDIDATGMGNIKYYKNRTAWFHGAWLDPGLDWKWNGEDVGTVDGTAMEYPRVYNARIDRSDFIRFLEVDDPGSDSWKFVLYVPEKNIDDANTIGNPTDTPKIPHLEIRFDEWNENLNFDDNGAYRVYFVDYSSIDVNDFFPFRDGYGGNGFEKNKDKLSKLYPILRNHIYRFKITNLKTVNGAGGINFQLCSPANRYQYGNGITFE